MTPAAVLSNLAPWAMIHGDCLAADVGLPSLPDGCAQHVITDPPYSEHVHGSTMRGAKKWKGAISERSDLGFAHLDHATREGVADQCARLASRWVLVFSDTESAHLWRADLTCDDGLEYVRTVVWHKIAGAPQFTGDRPAVAVEAITVCHRPGKKRWNGGGKQGLYSCRVAVERPESTTDTRCHPTQKPLALMEQLVADFTDPGDLVLDPFAGSGTTGVACIRLGRRFIGWERDAKHYATACKRIGAAREQLGLFGGAKATRGKQLRLGGEQ